MATKVKVAALTVPETRDEFHAYLREMRGIAEQAVLFETDRDNEVARLEAEIEAAKHRAAAQLKPRAERFGLLWTAAATYFRKHRRELLEAGKKSYAIPGVTIGERLVGPAISFRGKAADIVDAIIELGWVKRFCTLAPSKKKMHADTERARQIPGVKVAEQRDELFMKFLGLSREGVKGKLRKRDEDDEEEGEAA